MARKRTHSPEAARAELKTPRSRPAQRSGAHSLPFHDLSPDEFEVACFLLLHEEHVNEPVYYFGKTGDAGRDIIYRSSQGTELVQCKRYKDNVGVGDVRAELAKLCTNIHRGLIPEPIARVSFYVSADLTADAHDMLDQQSLWVEASRKALTEHLEEEPDAGLIAFAHTWWPTFGRESGIALTKRFERHPRLIEEFFSVRKVVDATALVPIASGLDELQRKMDLSLQLQRADAFEKLRLLVAEAEVLNPGVAITAESSLAGTRLRISARPESGELRAGRLSFPDSEAGQRGLKKYTHMRETGHAVTFESGEFAWASELKLPGNSDDNEVENLTAEPRLPDTRIAVRMECRRSGIVVSSLPIVYMRVLRLGSKEAEIVLDAARYSASFRFSLRWHSPSSGTSEFDFTEKKVGDVLTLGRFLLDLESEGSSLTLINVEREDELATFQGIGFGLSEEIANSVTLLENLSLINKALNCDLRHPAELDEYDAKTAAIIAGGIRHCRIADPDPPPLTFPVPRPDLVTLIKKWRKNEPVRITATMGGMRFFLLNTSLEVGQVEMTMVDARPEEPLAELEARANVSDSVEPQPAAVTGSMLIYEFSRWRRESDDKTPTE